MRTKQSDRGSATLELVLIMPIILAVILMVIYLIFDSINDSYTRADIYQYLYTYDGREAPMKIAEEMNINRLPVGRGENTAYRGRDKNGVYVELSPGQRTAGGEYQYVADSATYRVEYGKCEERLRRWQFYGDVLWE